MGEGPISLPVLDEDANESVGVKLLPAGAGRCMCVCSLLFSRNVSVM